MSGCLRLAPRLRRRRNFGLRRGSPLWGVGGPVGKTWENRKGRELGHFFKESASCEKPTSCVKAVMLTALQRLPRLRRRRNFGLRRGSPLWGVGGPVGKTWENKKGRELGHFFKAPASCEKPKFCVKAVMLTAVQRLAPRLRRKRNFGLRRGSPLWGVGGPVGKTWENKKGRDLGHFFQSPGVLRETDFLRQSGDAHRSPKAGVI